jgi:hypothetical protein
MIHQKGQYISWAWIITTFLQVWIQWVIGQSSSSEIVLGLGEEVYRTQHEGLQPLHKYLITLLWPKLIWNVRGQRLTSRLCALFCAFIKLLLLKLMKKQGLGSPVPGIYTAIYKKIILYGSEFLNSRTENCINCGCTRKRNVLHPCLKWIKFPSFNM